MAERILEMNISYPIFIKAIDDKHVILIDSADKINYILEPIDVENNEYIAWDREGFPLEIRVDKQRGIIFEKLDKSNEFKKLRESIIDYAKIYGVFDYVKELFEKEIDLATTLKYIELLIAEKERRESFLNKIKRKIRFK